MYLCLHPTSCQESKVKKRKTALIDILIFNPTLYFEAKLVSKTTLKKNKIPRVVHTFVFILLLRVRVTCKILFYFLSLLISVYLLDMREQFLFFLLVKNNWSRSCFVSKTRYK